MIRISVTCEKGFVAYSWLSVLKTGRRSSNSSSRKPYFTRADTPRLTIVLGILSEKDTQSRNEITNRVAVDRRG